jgi:DNA-binding PadR family transcriptional regulator
VARPLNNTGILVLGMVAAGRRNGYEIQHTVERSTRHFWTASPGGIYPELRRLEQAGLLRSTDDPRGAARRLSYELTADGAAALREWLADEHDALFEMRHEDLLRLFFASELPTRDQLKILERIALAHERKAHDLESITAPWIPDDAPESKRLVLDYGIALHRGAAAWCRQAAERLAPEEATRRRSRT